MFLDTAFNDLSNEKPDIEVLLQRFLEGTLLNDQADTLLRLLRDDPELRRQAARQMDFDAELRQWALSGVFFQGSPETVTDAFPVSIDPDFLHNIPEPVSYYTPRSHQYEQPQEKESILRILSDRLAGVAQPTLSIKWVNRLIAVNVATIILVVFCMLYNPNAVKQAVSVAETGRLLGFQNIRWQNEPSWDASGFRLLSDRLTMLSGSVALKLENGTRFLMNGATDVQLISSNEIACHAGHLVVEVPRQEQSFQVRLPQFTVAVLGTIFDIRVDKDGSTIHLKEGRVSIKGLPSSPFYLEEGGSLTVSPALEVKSFVTTATPTPSFAAIETRSEQRYDVWKRQSHQLRNDPATVVYMGFERTSMKQEMVGRLSWSQGHIPGKWALRFPGSTHDLRLSLENGYPKATVFAWIRRESGDNSNRMFFRSDAVAWEWLSDGNLCWSAKKEGIRSLIPIPEDILGDWIFVAVTIDGDAGTIKHYINGKEILSDKIDTKTIDAKNACLGGGVQIDEFLFSKRIYSSEEIESIYVEANGIF